MPGIGKSTQTDVFLNNLLHFFIAIIIVIGRGFVSRKSEFNQFSTLSLQGHFPTKQQNWILTLGNYKGEILLKVYFFVTGQLYLKFPAKIICNFHQNRYFSLSNLVKSGVLHVRNCRKSIISDLEYFEMCHFQEIWSLFLAGNFKCGQNYKGDFDFWKKTYL